MKKFVVFLLISLAYIGINAQNEDNVDLIAFWTAAVQKLGDNPEFRKHAEANLKRVTTLKESGVIKGTRPVTKKGFMDQMKEFAERQGWKDKAKEMKNKLSKPEAAKELEKKKAAVKKQAKAKKKEFEKQLKDKKQKVKEKAENIKKEKEKEKAKSK